MSASCGTLTVESDGGNGGNGGDGGNGGNGGDGGDGDGGVIGGFSQQQLLLGGLGVAALGGFAYVQNQRNSGRRPRRRRGSGASSNSRNQNNGGR